MKNESRGPVRTALIGAAVAALTLVALAGAATTTLPGGTSFEVVVTSPGNGAVLPEATAYTVSGRATIGTAAPVANTFLITAIDVSGSTSQPVSTTACGNVNTVHDTALDTTLDCELAAARALNNAAVSQGTVAQAALVGFSGGSGHDTLAVESAAQLDVGPAAGAQGFVPPSTDANANGTRDIDDVLASAWNRNISSTHSVPGGTDAVGFSRFSLFDFYGNTNFWAAVKRIRAVAATAPAGLTKIGVLLSDGESTRGGPGGVRVSDALAGIGATGIRIYTFAIGNAASCAGSPASDYGNLQEIATATGATCTHITSPEQAVDAVPDAIGSRLAAFALSDGGSAYAPATTVTPVPPATLSGGTVAGPATTDFSRTYPAAGATPGAKTLCARATGSDGGGSSTLTDCVNVTIKARPTVSAGDNGTVAEGTAFALAGSASDGALAWSSSGGTGTCSFADAASATTSVTCTDDGAYTLTLTSDDGVNPAQSSSMALTVTNVAPTPTLTLSAGPHPLAQPVTATVAIADPGSDTHSCEINWGDGTTTAGCGGSHVYGAAGSHLVSVTATDDDGDSGSDTESVLIDGPPTVSAGGDRSGLEGGLVALAGSVSDNGSTTNTWSATPGAGVDAGASCSFTNASAPATSVRCTDDGTWTLTLRSDDGVNPPVSDSLTLELGNAAPSVVITSPPAGASTLGVSLLATVADPGTNDGLTCTVAWGDSSSTGGTVSGGVCSATHTYAAGTPGATLTVTVSDDDGASASASRSLVFNRAPSCAAVVPSVATLWPPNHALRLITLRGATDPDGDSLTYTIVSVRQDEPLNGAGDGNTARDAQLASGGSVWLRAERSGNGDGRVYTVAYRVSDGQASCTGSVRVGVPHSVNRAAILTPGPGFDSLG